jgi:hypothetical protein
MGPVPLPRRDELDVKKLENGGFLITRKEEQ